MLIKIRSRTGDKLRKYREYGQADADQDQIGDAWITAPTTRTLINLMRTEMEGDICEGETLSL